MIELGCRQFSTGTGTASIRIGDASARDLLENETATVDDNPWMEVSVDLFGGGGAPGVVSSGMDAAQILLVLDEF